MFAPPLCVKMFVPTSQCKDVCPPPSYVLEMFVFQGQTNWLFPGGQTKKDRQTHSQSALYIWHRVIFPLPPPFRMVKNYIFRRFKINCKNWFRCWNLTHLLIRKNKKSDPKMGTYRTPKIQLNCCFYISAHTEATSMIFIWGHRGYPPICF